MVTYSGGTPYIMADCARQNVELGSGSLGIAEPAKKLRPRDDVSLRALLSEIY